ncbi:hypothetical protein [Roseibium sediminis]|uniref:hypothetical protein n=1 Tax=Roseibium sediminis TaxID=1775174 RepID=UPI00123CB687|nr:hypothetical protein [Roseibium sediminis]
MRKFCSIALLVMFAGLQMLSAGQAGAWSNLPLHVSEANVQEPNLETLRGADKPLRFAIGCCSHRDTEQMQSGPSDCPALVMALMPLGVSVSAPQPAAPEQARDCIEIGQISDPFDPPPIPV